MADVTMKLPYYYAAGIRMWRSPVCIDINIFDFLVAGESGAYKGSVENLDSHVKQPLQHR